MRFALLSEIRFYKRPCEPRDGEKEEECAYIWYELASKWHGHTLGARGCGDTVLNRTGVEYKSNAPKRVAGQLPPPSRHPPALCVFELPRNDTTQIIRDKRLTCSFSRSALWLCRSVVPYRRTPSSPSTAPGCSSLSLSPLWVSSSSSSLLASPRPVSFPFDCLSRT